MSDDVALSVRRRLHWPPPCSTIIRTADVVLTMGCGVACTLYPGKPYFGSAHHRGVATGDFLL